jgi:hypothetical protein
VSRVAVRQHKRSMSRAGVPDAGDEQRRVGRESAVSLLMRSIAFQHRRLAVVRLNEAARLGADVPLDAWNYCRLVAAKSEDERLRALFLEAALRATTGAPAAGR